MTDRVVIITGASGGLGAATARALVAAGDMVVLGSRRPERLASLSDDLGDAAVWRKTDVSRRGDMDSLAALALDRFGRIDVLINNAAIMPISLIEQGMVDDWDKMIDINIKGMLYGINAVLPHMLSRNSGTIITVASTASMKAAPTSAVYSGTKAAQRMISEGLRQETNGRIRISTVHPGVMDSDLHASITVPEMRDHALRTMTNALDTKAVARAILYILDQPPEVELNEVVMRRGGDIF